MNRFAAAFLLLLIATFATVTSNALQENPAWIKCEKDLECIVVKGICEGPTAINRKFKKDTKHLFPFDTLAYYESSKVFEDFPSHCCPLAKAASCDQSQAEI